jgi:hypothetical protein
MTDCLATNVSVSHLAEWQVFFDFAGDSWKSCPYAAVRVRTFFPVVKVCHAAPMELASSLASGSRLLAECQAAREASQSASIAALEPSQLGA